MDDILTRSRILIRMIKALILLFALLAFMFNKSFSQAVALSAYLNKADPRDEYTELIVNADNIDMRGWSIRDNSSGNNWQPAITFNNISFWNHLRIGTIIFIWHRQINTSGINHPVDINKTDGYIELYAFNPIYFTGGDVNNSMNLAQAKDVIQLRDASGTHIHALGHGNPELGSFIGLPAPKLNYLASLVDGDEINVSPGNNLLDYGSNLPNSGLVYSTKSVSPAYSAGLANSLGNRTYWQNTREPQFTAQIVNPSALIPGMPGSVSFSWTAATDPYNSDTTLRYLILRNTTNSFSSPVDGTTYAVGSLIGGASVIGIIYNSSSSSFTDNTAMNGNTYFYRIYAYRYGTDDINGSSYAQERGSAYNTVNYVSVLWPTTSPLPVELLSFNGFLAGNEIQLTWTTVSERNCDYFMIERSLDGKEFLSIGKVDGAGNSDLLIDYFFADSNPNQGLNYFRIKQLDYNGEEPFSKVITIQGPHLDSKLFSFQNPVEDNINMIFSGSDPVNAVFEIFDMNGKLVKNGLMTLIQGADSMVIQVSNLKRGSYLIHIFNNAIQYSHNF